MLSFSSNIHTRASKLRISALEEEKETILKSNSVKSDVSADSNIAKLEAEIQTIHASTEKHLSGHPLNK
jgi:hypothetical protein